MSDYSTLKGAIQAVIKQNGNNEITGNLLQQALLAMINSLGANYQFAGVATPETNPGTPDQNVFYICAAGTYPNFNSAVIPFGHLGVFLYSGTWTTQTFKIGLQLADTSYCDFAIVDDTLRSIVEFLDGHIRTKNFDSKQSPKVVDGLDDFSISDPNGNSIFVITNGHIRTKNFDSRGVPEIISGPGDFSVVDNNGNILALFYNGHIRTKNFDSSKAATDKLPYSRENVHFSVNVNVNMLKNTEPSDNLQDGLVQYSDSGVLMLPESYTPNGKPTRLVIACHGAGGGVSDHDSQTESLTTYKYLVANGYAVMDMGGMPPSWVETWWGDYEDFNLPADKKQYVKVNNMGCPLAIECYVKGYEWVVQHYNIAQDGVLVAGGSMGGLSSSNLVMSGRIPVLAHGIFAPVLDTFNQAFLNPWTQGVSKYAISKLYGFALDGNNEFVYDSDKVCGYNPIINGMQSYSQNGRVSSVGTYDFNTKQLNNESVVEYKNYPCPVKIWHCINDGTVNIACSERHINAIKNAGGMAWLRKFLTGGHAPDAAGTIVANPTGSTVLKGVSVGSIYPAIEELFLFFNRYSV